MTQPWESKSKNPSPNLLREPRFFHCFLFSLVVSLVPLLFSKLWWVGGEGQPQGRSLSAAFAFGNIRGNYHLDSISLLCRYLGNSRTLSDIKTSSSYAHSVLRKQTHTLLLVLGRGNSGLVQLSALYICLLALHQAQAALSSAVRPTMAQPAQNILIRVLLLWTTLLSIILAVFIILFFKAEKHGLVRPLYLLLFSFQIVQIVTISNDLKTWYKYKKSCQKCKLRTVACKWCEHQCNASVLSCGFDSSTAGLITTPPCGLQVVTETPVCDKSYPTSSCFNLSPTDKHSCAYL